METKHLKILSDINLQHLLFKDLKVGVNKGNKLLVFWVISQRYLTESIWVGCQSQQRSELPPSVPVHKHQLFTLITTLLCLGRQHPLRSTLPALPPLPIWYPLSLSFCLRLFPRYPNLSLSFQCVCDHVLQAPWDFLIVSGTYLPSQELLTVITLTLTSNFNFALSIRDTPVAPA